MQNQFEHLSETYFGAFDYDIGERELGYVQSFDNDLDMFLASIALTKTSLEDILKDDGMNNLVFCFRFSRYLHPLCFIDVTIEAEENPSELLGPLQGLLDQTKSLKVLSR